MAKNNCAECEKDILLKIYKEQAGGKDDNI